MKHIPIGTVETLIVSFEVMPYLFIKEKNIPENTFPVLCNTGIYFCKTLPSQV